jgi:hypothetical protein
MADITRLEAKIDLHTTRLENMIHSEFTHLGNKIESVETKIDLEVRDMTIRMGAIERGALRGTRLDQVLRLIRTLPRAGPAADLAGIALAAFGMAARLTAPAA